MAPRLRAISQRLTDSVRSHEGFRAVPYRDTEGIWTVGYGTNLQAIEVPTTQAETWMRRALERVRDGLLDVPGFAQADPVRQDVLIEMAYQLGVRGTLRFTRMWAAVARGDWWAAASEMLDSRWARDQTPIRARTLAHRMRTGLWEGASPV